MITELLEQHQALEDEVFDRPDRVVRRDEKIKSRAISLIAKLTRSLEDATPGERALITQAIQLWGEILRVHYRIFDVPLPSAASRPEPRDGGSGGEDRESSAPARSSSARDDAYIIWRAWNDMAFQVARSGVDIGHQLRQEMIDSVEAGFSEALGILRSWVREPARIDRIGSELASSLTRREDRTVDSVRRLITTLDGAIEGARQERAASAKEAERSQVPSRNK